MNRIVGGQRGRNVTLIAAISDRVGILYRETHVTTVTKGTFRHFLTSLQAILGDEEAVLIMDNAPVHMDMQNDFPNLEIKYLPAYSPFLNPIENFFLFSKHI